MPAPSSRSCNPRARFAKSVISEVHQRDPNAPGYVRAKDGRARGHAGGTDLHLNNGIGPTARFIPALCARPMPLANWTPDPVKLIVAASRPAPYTRRVAVYVPKQYV